MMEMTELQIATRRHVEMDMLIEGTFGETNGGKFKGCSIGCIVHERLGADFREGNIHLKASKFYDAPEWWFLLQDAIFEGLPDLSARGKWHIASADAIAAHNDADLDWRLTLHRVHAEILKFSLLTAGSAKDAVSAVIDLHEKAAKGEDVESAAMSAAESAAWSAAWSAAMSAAESAAMSAAESAAMSAARSAAESAAMSAAESAARSAAMSAAESAARSAAESAAYEDMAKAVLIAVNPAP